MLAQDYILMNEKKWFLMEHEEYGTRAAYVILSEDGAVVMNDCSFGELSGFPSLWREPLSFYWISNCKVNARLWQG